MKDTQKETVKRDTNIELLRIIALFMIIAAHMVIYGIIENPSDDLYKLWIHGTKINKILACMLVPGGDAGVGVFLIISGYFLLSKVRIERLIKIILEIFFYSAISIVGFFLISQLTDISVNLSIFDAGAMLLLPVSSGSWWFATAYIVLVFMAPSINGIAKQMSKKQFGYLIIFLYMLWYVLGKILGVRYYSFIRAFWFYLIGAYIKMHSFKTNRKILWTLFIISWILYAISTFIIGEVVGNDISNSMLELGNKMLRSTVWSPISSISLFLLFLNTRIGLNKKINKIAATTFGIYLAHETPICRLLIWNEILKIGELYSKKYFPLTAVVAITGVFGLLMCLDIIRMRIAEHLQIRVLQKIKHFFQ